MRKDSFFAEALRAVVAHHKKKVREDPPDYFLNQKKQLWYGMMSIVDSDEDAQEAQGAQAQPGKE